MAELRFSYIEQRADRTELVKKWLIRAIVGIAFVFIGKSKFDSHSEWIGIFQRLGFGQWLRYFTGVLQIGGGLLLLIPRTVAIGIAMLALTMVGAMASWIFFLGMPLFAIIPGAILGALIAIGAEDVMELVSWCRKRLFKF